MAEEAPDPVPAPAAAPAASAAEPAPEASDPKPDETLAAPSCEAVIESSAQGGAAESSSCNNNGETSAITSDGDREKTLEFAAELMAKGSAALREGDFSEATDCFSRALEIRVAHYGELALECVDAYYKFGSALLSKSQEEADPLVSVPKKDVESQQNSDKDASSKVAVNCESTTASTSSIAGQDGNSNDQEGAVDDGSSGQGQEHKDEDSDDEEDLAEADEDESDLDLAWKMLDLARAIVEKHSQETILKVDILSALAEVSLEREDVETSLSDYLKALSILERLVEPDSRHLAELNFRICLCLEIGSKASEAIPYCEKAKSICKSRMERLADDVKVLSVSATTSAGHEASEAVEQPSSGSHSINSVSDKEAEIESLKDLLSELDKKLEDLQQVAANPKPVLSDMLGFLAAKAKASAGNGSAAMSSTQMGTANSNGDFDSPTVSTAHTNGAAGVTHLGVVGRGVKRVLTSSAAAESGAAKRPALSSSSHKGEDNNAS